MHDTSVKPLPELTQADIDRFWSKVDMAPGQGKYGRCWKWIGGKSNMGYGTFKAQKKQLKAHRVAFRLYYGGDPYPADICHTCDDPECVSPECFFLGDNVSNTADSTEKRRRAYGDRNGQRTHPERTSRGESHRLAKLSDAQVAEIPILKAAGKTLREIGEIMGCTAGNIGHILHGRSRKGLKKK